MHVTISQFEDLIYEELRKALLEKNGSYGVTAPPGVEEYQKLPEDKQRRLAVQFRAFLDSGGGGLSDAEQAAVDLIFPSKTVGDTDWRGTHNDEWTDFIGAMADDIGQKTGVGFYSKIVDTFDKWLKDNKVFNIGIWQAIQGPVLSKNEIFAVIKQFIRSKGELRIVTARIIPQIKSILKKKGKSQNEINKILDAVTDQADKMKKVINDLMHLNL